MFKSFINDPYLPIITILGLFLFAAILMGSCGGQGGDSQAPPPRAPVLLGYSLPNAWHTADADQFTSALRDAGHTATEIEWIPWRGAPPVCNGTTNKSFPEAGEAFVRSACSAGLTTFVNIVNANACAQTNQPTSWFQDRLNEVKRLPPECIIVSGVSEPWADGAKMHQWTQLARQQLGSPYVLAANGGSAKPFYNDVPFDYLDSHPCKESTLLNLLRSKQANLLVNSDCGPLLNPGPQFAQKWTTEALQNGTPLLIYDFAATEPDYEVIAAMGEVIQ